MKKLLLATIACTFIAAPAFANDFATEQAKVLSEIITKMDEMKNDPIQMDLLTNKRNCVEKATNIEGLQECLTKNPSMEQQAAKN